jgi:hypothetical protein
MKKILTITMALMVFFSSSYQVKAWGGYTHWDIASRTSSSLSSTNKLYYKSGALLADIGKASLDGKIGNESDGALFTDIILQEASSGNEQRRYFASGWKAHYIHDNSGSVSNIPGPYSGTGSYRLNTAWVDEYLRDVKNINSPVDGSASIVVDYSLIRAAYNRFGFYVSNSAIDQEIVKMYNLYNAAILANFKSYSSSQKSSIENELNRIKSLCKTQYLPGGGVVTYSTTMMVEPLVQVEEDISIDFTTMASENEIIEQASLEINTLNEELASSNVTSLEKMKIEEGVYIITFKVNDEVKYNNKLNEMNKVKKKYKINK